MLNNNTANNGTNNGTNSGVVAGEINGPVNVTVYNKKLVPSLITKLVERLAVMSDVEVQESYRITKPDITAYDIPEKIKWNNVMKYNYLIEDYTKYHELCETALNILDDSFMRAKTKILRNINEIYKKCKGELLLKYKSEVNMDIIRENADYIIEYVRQELMIRIEEGFIDDTLYLEDLQYGLNIFICYAFIECKILENPNAVKV